MFLYCALNVVSAKRYIGITTVSLDARWRQHLGAAVGGAKTPLHRAIRKYGAEAFVVEEIASLLPNFGKEELFALERQLIAQEATQVPGGYNVAPGGEGITSVGYPDELRVRLSNARKGRSIPSLKGKPLDAEHRVKLSAAWTNDRRTAQGDRLREVQKAGQNDATNEKRRAVWTEEKRAEHRARNIARVAAEKAAGTFKAGPGSPWTDERRVSQGAKAKGRKVADATRAKIKNGWTDQRRAAVAAKVAARRAMACAPQSEGIH